MREISILKQRILQYIDNKDITKSEFYEICKLSNGILSQSNGMSEDSILKILYSCKDINLYWWFLGEGEMLRTSERKNTTLTKQLITQPYVNSESNLLIKDLINQITSQAIELGRLKCELECLKNKNV